MPEDPSIVGQIRPGPGEDASPLFEILPRSHWQRDEEDECQHGRFQLDDKWKTVKCGKCGETLDPYAVLAQYGEWWDEYRRTARVCEAREKDLHKAEAKRLRRLRDCSEDETAEINRALDDWYRLDVKATRGLVNRIGKAIRERKWRKRRARRGR